MKTTVVIPTFNERENIGRLLDRINSLGIKGLEILVVDDNSPDGTWELVEEKKKKAGNVNLIRRLGMKGRGFAVREGFLAALENGADFVLEMDADFSHSPEYIPSMLTALDESDAVIGSRFVEGGGMERRSPLRNIVTLCAHKYLRLLFRCRVKDPTSGFRGFTKKALEKIEPASLKAGDYFGVTEILHRCRGRGLLIKEVPITFRERAGGDSKLGSMELFAYLWKALMLKFGRFASGER